MPGIPIPPMPTPPPRPIPPPRDGRCCELDGERSMVGFTDFAQGDSLSTSLASSSLHSATCFAFQGWSAPDISATVSGSMVNHFIDIFLTSDLCIYKRSPQRIRYGQERACISLP